MRKLRADEIECRVAQVSSKGCSLLLYKTARVDRAILDEEFGAMGWQNDFKVIDGKMYGGIGVWHNDLKEWIWRWDCGTESNTEAEKGQASDCFKRAGFKWAIGVELYTAPFIWLNVNTVKDEFASKKAGKDVYKLADKFAKYSVKSIEYNNDTISNLEIVDDKSNTVYSMGKKVTKTTQKSKDILDERIEELKDLEPAETINTDSNEIIAIGLRASNNMKELLAVYNENKTQIEADPNLKSIFKEVKKSIIDKM